jgi:radical SAM superfamily enzyme YgiQ (UPF0313 family)
MSSRTGEPAGCEAVFFGIESGSDRILRGIEKGFGVDKILDTVRRTVPHMTVNANLMWGFPGETPDDTDRTLKLRRELEQLGVSCSLIFLAPLSSAPLYRASSEKAELLTFSPRSPNIFYEDYDDLIPEDRPRIDSMISASPKLFCAFYYFRSEHLEQVWDRVRFELAAERINSFANAPWQTV